jgi:zinc transporter 9
MADVHAKSAVIKAIVGNAFVTMTKAIAAVFSGSGAMYAETIHSLVDTLNQGLLLIGVKRSSRAATGRHPYGFGPEAAFWGLLAAIGILAFGGGLSIQHGIHSLEHPQVPEQIGLVFAVLAVATVIEGLVLASVLRSVARTRGDDRWSEHLKVQSPGTITVILEDAAAVLGCLIAALAVGLCVATGDGIYDAVAQLFIGAMLAAVGVYLIWRNRGALIGQSLPEKKLMKLRIFLEDIDGIDRIHDLKTRQLTAHTFSMKAEVVFSGGELAQRLMHLYVEKVQAATDEDESAEVLGRFAEALIQEQAKHVDRMELEILDKFPGAVHIDLEPHLRDLP